MRMHWYAVHMPRHVDHDQRRAEILYGVFAVIAEHGLPGVSLRSVAAAAGVSMGRVQHYFPTKDELIHQACQAIVTEAEAGYDQQSTADASPRELLRAMTLPSLPRTHESRLGTSVWMAFVTAAVTDPVLGDIVRDAWQGTEREMARLLRQAEQARTLAPGIRSTRAARTLMATMNGLVTLVMVRALTHGQARAALAAQIDGLFA